MEIHFKSAHTKDVEDEVTPEIISITQRKIISLKKYLGKTDVVTQVYVEFGKATEAHHSGNVWRTQINLDSRGKRYHATAVAENIQMAADAAIKDLEATLRKNKQRGESMLKRGGIRLKDFMRGFGK